jgi:hypothetical protein
MEATLRFDLDDPDDAREHRCALAGRDALIDLERIDQHCRGRIKHGELGDEAQAELETVRRMIAAELTELLH